VFKFEFETKEFEFLKDLNNEKAFFYFLLAMGRISTQAQPAKPLPHPAPDQQRPS
jgi:hypothetical protein